MNPKKAIVDIAKKQMQTIRSGWLQDRKYVNLPAESKMKGTSNNWFSAAFHVWATGKIFGGYLRVATLKSSCIVLLAHTLKIHPIDFLEIP